MSQSSTVVVVTTPSEIAGGMPVRIQATALDALRRGFSPIAGPLGQKRPTTLGWQHLHLTEADIPRHFNGRPQNTGILIGQASRNTADVDIDANEGVPLASAFLPATGAIFGRGRRPRTHHLFRCTGTLRPTTRLRDPTKRDDDEGSMLVEYQFTGCQTLYPGSTHPDGDTYRWASDDEPGPDCPTT